MKETDGLEIWLARQCAPMLMGLKSAVLLRFQTEDVKRAVRLFVRIPFYYKILYESDNDTVVLFYKKETVSAILEAEKAFFRKQGYEGNNLSEVLEEIKCRYTSHMAKRTMFPHEVGILLGYPTKDVDGFMKNQGEHALYTGDWKVYQNLSESLRIFELFKKSRRMTSKMIKHGFSIQQIWEQHIVIK